ncbi:MAG TPA: prolyl oligopeptidase family serine peptidase [Kofleriaceae bacterium]
MQPGVGSAIAPAPQGEPAASTFVGMLAKERAEHATQIAVDFKTAGPPPPVPPAATKLARIKYRTKLGEMWAYVTQDPGDAKRHPAVVWAAGGFDPSIGAEFFAPGPAKNDQSASQLRAAGIIVMYPSYRGAHDNPGTYELLYGEVDDYLAAADHLRNLSYVDPARIYFGGHSTGGTLVLLAAALTDQFRAAFVFGPVTGAKSYGERVAPFDRKADAAREWRLRAPLHFVRDIRRPTLVIEGDRSSNARALPSYQRAAAATGVPLTTQRPADLDHYSVLAPQLELIARKIVADDGRGDFAW